jgi:alpha-amylase/alpha-mannosidase (GH57 family)
MERYICIHGHFYQPPRENPWLEDIEVQDSAYPFQRSTATGRGGKPGEDYAFRSDTVESAEYLL